jgi:WhiB family transcriptional regulator, redox-sensing transcriptional regulator
MNWDADAACRSAEPEVFFPETTSSRAIAAAKLVCNGCPVRAKCLEFALETRLDHGVWGGLTENERRSLRRSRQRKARRLSAAIA